ncbi:MAG: ATP-dependent Clp protease ATP-binding subunit ClpX [Parasporobacterium sp.]|nr:ATP-dependent Clp protease ATP-binding subunit ClpX [Parasporobacterium sp.]
MPNNSNYDDRECVCSVCHRTESKAGQMLTLPGGISICMDCLQKTINNVDLSGIDPSMLGGMNPFMGFPAPGFPFPGNTPAEPDEQEDDLIEEDELSAITDSEDTQNTEEQDSEAMPSGAEEGETKEPSSEKEPASPGNQGSTLGKIHPVKKSSSEVYQEALKRNQERRDQMKKDKKTPNISFINLSDLQNTFGRRQQIKRKDPSERKGPLIDPSKILPPHKLKAKLDEYVVGQEKAKKAISVAVYNHYKRILAGDRFKDDDVEIEKSNMLLIGPTGCGKTYIVKTLAKLLDVPLAITDATSLTEAGYIGDDIESVLSKLLQAADNDLDRAEIGIVFIDEIDKIAKKNSNRGRDVSGESVQQGLLKLLEGAEVEVPVGAASKNAMVPLTTVNTKNILFICGGAFPDLEDIIKERVKKKTSMGFGAELKDVYENDENIMEKVTTEDLRKFGMIPEFLGRLPIVCTLQKLTGEMLVQVLKEPKNAILKQYQKLLEMDEVQLEFEDDALLALTERAQARETGARGLRSILEEIMLDIMYEIPKDDSIGKVVITRDYIENNGAPIISIRSNEKQNWTLQLPPPQTANQE